MPVTLGSPANDGVSESQSKILGSDVVAYCDKYSCIGATSCTPPSYISSTLLPDALCVLPGNRMMEAQSIVRPGSILNPC